MPFTHLPAQRSERATLQAKLRIAPTAVRKVIAKIVHFLYRGRMRTEEAHHLAPEAELGARRLCDPGARDPQHDGGIVRIGPGDCLPDRGLEAEVRRRIEERMDLLAGKPRAGFLPVERTAASGHDVPALAQNDLGGREPAAVYPDLLQVLCDRVAREEIARCSKTQARDVAGLHLRPPSPGVAQDVGFEAALGLEDRRFEARCRTRWLRHAPQRGLIGFNPRALGLLPALYQ
jgi:hypothetical protein